MGDGMTKPGLGLPQARAVLEKTQAIVGEAHETAMQTRAQVHDLREVIADTRRTLAVSREILHRGSS